MNELYTLHPIATWLAVLLLILLIGFLIAIVIGAYENKKLVTTHYVVTSNRLPEGFLGHKFCVLADLHNNSFGNCNELLIAAIDKIAPDFLLIAGDLIIGNEICNYDIAIGLLEQLAKKYPIYYAYGNHEQKVVKYEVQAASLQTMKKNATHGRCTSLTQYETHLKNIGIHILKNESLEYALPSGETIEIIGGLIDLDYFKRRNRPTMSNDYLEQLLGKNQKEHYQVLIAHNPMYFEEYAMWGADLVVSGHVHGGMVRLPFLGGVISPQMKLFPKYDAGLYTTKYQNHKSSMVVSRGLGIHTIKIRVFNRPELVCIQFGRKEKE